MRRYWKPVGQLGVEDHDRLGPEQAVLRAAEGEDVNADVGAQRRERAAERGGGVAEPGSVHVDDQAVAVGQIRECAQSPRAV